MDRVRLIPLERAELEDHLALQELVYEHIKKQTGGLLGSQGILDGRGGLLTHPQPVVDNVDRLTFSNFAFCYIQKSQEDTSTDSFTPIASVVRFYGSDAGHTNHPLDLSAMQPGTPFYIYVKTSLVDSDTTLRRQFSLVAGQEVSITMETRQRERCTFMVGTTDPLSGGWVKILNGSVNTDTGTRLYQFTPVSLWDESNEKTASYPTATMPAISLETSNLLQSANRSGSHTFGLNELLAHMRAQFTKIMFASTSDTPQGVNTLKRWYDTPLHSLESLYLAITANTTAIDGVNNSISSDISTAQHLSVVIDATFDDSQNTSSANITRIASTSANVQSGIEVAFNHFYSQGRTVGDPQLDKQRWRKIIRLPIVIFDRDVDILSFNVVPLTLKVNEPTSDSLTQTYTESGGDVKMPIPFTFSRVTLISANINSTATSSDFHQVIPHTFYTGAGTGITRTESHCLPISINFEEISGIAFGIRYEINIIFKEV